MGVKGKPQRDVRPPLTTMQRTGIDLRCIALNRSGPGSQVSRRGQRCKNRVLPGEEYCRAHLPVHLRRRGTPTNGRYSSRLPPDLLERYEASRADDKLLVLTEEIHLVDARIATLTEGLSDGGGSESAAMWREVKQQLKEVADAYRKQEYSDAVPTLLKLADAANGPLSDAMAWDELAKWIDRRARLAESERKRMLDLQQYVPVARAHAMVQAIGSIIQQHVQDPLVLRAIADDIGRVLSGSVAAQLARRGEPAQPE